MRHAGPMQMDVEVDMVVVLVGVGMNPFRQSSAQSPQANTNEHHGNQTLAPDGERFQVDETTEEDCHAPNQSDASCVA
jgi:hypothetical protein